MWRLPPTKDWKHPSDYHHPHLPALYFGLYYWMIDHWEWGHKIMRENALFRKWALSHGEPMDMWEMFNWEVGSEIDREIVSMIIQKSKEMQT